MARMNSAEVDAAKARSRWEGAKEIADLVGKMSDLGLSLEAVAGALAAQVKTIGAAAVDAETAAIDSRAVAAAPEE
jgi:hypothetical protein